MVEVDPRLAARRQAVAEARARSGLSRVMGLLAFGLLIAAGVWLARSPLLALSSVSIEGIDPAEVQSLVAGAGLVPGRPMVTIRTGEVEAALAADPRVQAAVVQLQWPRGAVVYVEPRRVVAWAPWEGGWARVGIDGVVVSRADQPGPELPVLEITGVGADPSPAVLGGLAFLAELAPQPESGVRVRLEGDELWAEVAGTEVRLGRPVEMEAKARALVAVLAEGIPFGSTINLVAPTRPAVVPAESARVSIST
jgi:hypothetical protein